MSSKSLILKALEQAALTKQPMPEINVAPRIDDLVGQFETNLNTVAGTLHRAGSLDLVQEKVDSLIAEGKQVISLVEGISANRETPADQHDLKDIDFAVIPGELAVAENGAVWVKQPHTGHRVTPFICENLLLVVKTENLVPNMHEAVKKLTLESGDFGTFIAGPSKTADIEQALVVGAHGACSLNVYLV